MAIETKTFHAQRDVSEIRSRYYIVMENELQINQVSVCNTCPFMNVHYFFRFDLTLPYTIYVKPGPFSNVLAVTGNVIGYCTHTTTKSELHICLTSKKVIFTSSCGDVISRTLADVSYIRIALRPSEIVSVILYKGETNLRVTCQRLQDTTR